MEESVKAARLLHQIVVGVAATLLAFALSTPSSENDYTLALDELDSLTKAASDLPRLQSHELNEFYREHRVVDLLAKHLGIADSETIVVVPPETSFPGGRTEPERTEIIALESEVASVARQESEAAWRFDPRVLQEALKAIPPSAKYDRCAIRFR